MAPVPLGRQLLSPTVFVWALLLAGAIITVFFNVPELGRILDVLRRARLAYLPALGLVELIFVVNLGLFYAATFHAAGMKMRRVRLMFISAAAHFINLVSKSSGFGGLTLYLREGSRIGQPAWKTTTAYTAAYALGYVAFFVVLAVSLVLLYVQGSLSELELVASVVLLLAVGALFGAVAIALRTAGRLERLLSIVASPVNFAARRVRGRDLIGFERLHEMAIELLDAVRALSTNPRAWVLPFAHALAVELLRASMLFFVSRLLGAPLSVELAVAGYALAELSAILSVTPAGLGFVEASLTVFLISTGMNHQQAIAVTLGFRLFDFWVPVAIGAVSALALQAKGAGVEEWSEAA